MFSISQGFKLKLSKEGDDGLAVKDIVIDAGREECGSFLLFDVGCHIAQSERSGTKTSYFTDLEEGYLSNFIIVSAAEASISATPPRRAAPTPDRPTSVR